jgi:hypothetical protein
MSLFLIGAGFNIDATREAGRIYGNSMNVGLYQIDCGYPLVANVVRLCFGLDKVPSGKSVEDLFSEASQAGNYRPMETLVERLMEADYRIAQKLASSESANSYRELFRRFEGAQFLTFNYDSLPEIFLSQEGRWYPEDGYGVPVATELTFGVKQLAEAKSSSLVIHLHGSACVFTIESRIVGNPVGGIAQVVHLKEPFYAFDPDSISHCFPRYGRVVSATGRLRVAERVIAPVPDKSEGLKQAFIRESYAKALQLVRRAGYLIALGYGFNPYDRVSYNPVLEALARSHERRLILVSPEAGELAKRISAEYPDLRVRPVEKTFKAWAADSFRGL